jgi:hypothetical protein
MERCHGRELVTLPHFSPLDEPTSHLALDDGTLGPERGVPQLRLGADDHPPLASEVKVGDGAPDVDLADQLSGRVPDVDPIAASGVYVSLGVTVDP